MFVSRNLIRFGNITTKCNITTALEVNKFVVLDTPLSNSVKYGVHFLPIGHFSTLIQLKRIDRTIPGNNATRTTTTTTKRKTNKTKAGIIKTFTMKMANGNENDNDYNILYEERSRINKRLPFHLL